MLFCHSNTVCFYIFAHKGLLIDNSTMESSVFYSAHPVEGIKSPSKLMHSLFELFVVVGMDEDSGLVPLSRVML